MWAKRHLYIIIILFVGVIASTNATTPSKDNNFIAIADIHFDPFAGCSEKTRSCELFNKLKDTPYQNWEAVFSQYGEKEIKGYFEHTNYPLLKSSLEQASAVNKTKNPMFVLLLGDFYSHNFRKQYRYFSKTNPTMSYEAFSKKTLQFLTYEIQKTFPTVEVYPLIGNNDTYTNNYTVESICNVFLS